MKRRSDPITVARSDPISVAGMEAPDRDWALQPGSSARRLDGDLIAREDRVDFRRPLVGGLAELLWARWQGSHIPLLMFDAAAIVLPTVPFIALRRSLAVPVTSADIWCVNPLELWGGVGTSGGCGAYALLLPPSLLERLGCACPTLSRGLPATRGGAVRDVELAAALRRIADALGDARTEPPSADETVRLLKEMLWRSADPPPGPRVPAPMTPGIERAVAYLQTHVAQPVPLRDLTRIAQVTRSHFVRCFHRAVGLPPHAYLLQLRVARAATLLAAGAPLSEAAFEAGFADQSHMSRTFKAAYRLTPWQFARAVAGGCGAARSTRNGALPYRTAVHDDSRPRRRSFCILA